MTSMQTIALAVGLGLYVAWVALLLAQLFGCRDALCPPGHEARVLGGLLCVCEVSP